MNQAHFHLVLNHLPIVFPIVGLLIVIGGFIFCSEIVKRTGYIMLIIGAITTFPTFETGEAAEDIIEELNVASHDIIHEHEEVAETFAKLSYALGVISLIGLWANWKRKPYSNIVAFITIALGAVTLYFAYHTGTTGGEIRHPEIINEKSPVNAAEESEHGDKH